MRYYEKRQFQMLTMVSAWLKINKEAVQGKVPALNTLIHDFQERVRALELKSNREQKAVKISALEKMSTRSALTEVILRLSGISRAYHFQHKGAAVSRKKANTAKQGVAVAPHYTLTHLNRATADNLCKISEQVIQSVKRIKFGHLYGLTVDDIKDAEAYYKEFAAIRNSPKKRKKETAVRNKEISSSIKGCITILENSIDPLMRMATRDDWKMALGYKGVRKVLPRGQGRMSEEEEAYRKSRARKPKKGEGEGAA